MASLPPRVTSPSHWLLGPAYYAQRDPWRRIPAWIMIMTIVFCRHYRFELGPGFKVAPDPLITLRPKHGMVMVLRRRTFEKTPDRASCARDLIP